MITAQNFSIKIYFLINLGTDMIYQENFDSKIIISLFIIKIFMVVKGNKFPSLGNKPPCTCGGVIA